MSEFFFDTFWQSYLEYEVKFGFGLNQVKEEIKTLDIKSTDIVANVGINWGHSLCYIFENCPELNHLFAVDYSSIMLDLSKAVFSGDKDYLTLWLKQLSPDAQDYLNQLQARAKNYTSRTSFIFSSAEELSKKKIIFDKIAATMGFHWLEKPQITAFNSFNRSMREGGRLVFSTASAFYDSPSVNDSFTLNPYYLKFFDQLNRTCGLVSPQNNIIKKYSLEEIITILKETGFKLEHHFEHRIIIPKEVIDSVCQAGIKFRYPSEQIDHLMNQSTEILDRIKSEQDYSNYPQQYEICPIFIARKVRKSK